MTGFDSLSGDMPSAAADKLIARDLKKDQMLGAKSGDRASKAFGSHLSRLAQEQELKSAVAKTGGPRSDASRVETRAFVSPRASFGERVLTTAVDKIVAAPSISDETAKTDSEDSEDLVADHLAEQPEPPAATAADLRPPVAVLHAAMGFAHRFNSATDATSLPVAPSADTQERADTKPVAAAGHSDDTSSDIVPPMPSDSVEMPESPGQTRVETHGTSGEHLNIRAPLPTKVAVLSQETHFEPTLPSATLQQIVNAIGDQMSVPKESVTIPVTTTAAPSSVEKSGPVKTLTLQLDPASLGTVTVKMKLTGDAIDVQIAASRPETAQLLEHDRGTLNRLLQASGYDTDVTSIQVQSVTASAASADAGQSASNSQGQSGHASTQGQFDPSNQRAGDQRPGAQQNQQERRQFALPQEERHGGEPASRSGTIQSGALYL